MDASPLFKVISKAKGKNAAPLPKTGRLHSKRNRSTISWAKEPNFFQYLLEHASTHAKAKEQRGRSWKSPKYEEKMGTRAIGSS
jgi:hypothetical protein